MVATFVVAGALAVAAPLQASASGYVNQADIDIVQELDKQATTFWEHAESETTSLETIVSEGTKLKAAFQAVADHSFNTEISSDYFKAADDMKAATRQGAEVTGVFIEGIQSEDQAAQQAAGETFNTSMKEVMDKISAADTKMSEAIDASNNQEGTLYLVLTAAAAVMSLGSFIWAFRKQEATPELTKVRRGVAFGSLWILAGAALTYGTFLFADKLGGSYYIMYGPVVFGAILFVSSIANYVKLKHGAGSDTSANPPQTAAK